MNETPWEELNDTERSFLLTELLLQMRELDIKGNAGLAILCPPGLEEEVNTLWTRIIQVTTPESIQQALLIPCLPKEGTTRPTLYTSIDQESTLLSQYFTEKLTASGIDPSSLLPITPTLDALRGFYLTSILCPTLLSPLNS